MKVRSDCKLWSLKPAQREKLWAFLQEGNPSLADQRAFVLREFGLRVARGDAFKDFARRYSLQQDFAAAEQSAATATELMREFDPTDAERAEAFGQFVFTQAAIAAKDAETFVRMQSLKLSQDSARTKAELEREKLHISRQRLLLDKARAQLLRIAEQGLTETNKDGVAALIAEMERLGVRG